MNVSRQKDRRNGFAFPEPIFTRQMNGPRPKGRMERRLPIIVGIRLVQGAGANTDGEERTYTDNISPLGARVFSKRHWQPGDLVEITPVIEKPVLGEIIYCQRLPDERYSLGVKFEEGPVTWSMLQRYARS